MNWMCPCCNYKGEIKDGIDRYRRRKYLERTNDEDLKVRQIQESSKSGISQLTLKEIKIGSADGRS